eukprot:4651291-Heterocapsa_arctica.AAC.1
MASDFVPNLLTIMDVAEYADPEQVKGAEPKRTQTEKMTWAMETVLLREEIPEGRTCMPGQAILSAMLCHKKSCITCMAIKYTEDQQTQKRAGTEAKDIIELI